MQILRKRGRPVFMAMAVLAVLISIPYQSALAALVPTDALEAGSASDARERLDRFLAREDVRAEMRVQGIDPSEAQVRVQGLTDAEVSQIIGQIEQLPAGGTGLGLAVALLLVVFLVIVILKATGHLR